MGNYTISPRKVKHTRWAPAIRKSRHKHPNFKFTFIIIIALKGKTIATNLSKAITTRLRVQTTCETALRYIPNLQTVEAIQCTTYRDSWRQHSFADVQQPIE